MYYYIANENQKLGFPFSVKVAQKDDGFYRKREGNYFTDKDEAEAFCLKVNKMFTARGVSFKDKNGNDVHTGDIVTLDKDTTVVAINSEPYNGSYEHIMVANIAPKNSFVFLHNGMEYAVGDFSKVTKV